MAANEVLQKGRQRAIPGELARDPRKREIASAGIGQNEHPSAMEGLPLETRAWLMVPG